VTPPFPPPAPRAFRLGALDAGTAFLLLFGGIWGLVGTILAIVLSVAGGPFWNDLILDRRGVAAEARLTSVEPTSMHVSGGSVYRIGYTFADATGNTRAGSTGTTHPETIVGAGRQAPLAIEYDPEAPARSRLRGERASVIGLFGLLPLGFAVAGVLLFALGGRRAVRLRAIYVGGQAALATVTGIASSLMRVNGRRVMRVEYAFDTPSGRTQGRTTLRAPPPVGGTLWVIYDEGDPGRNVAA
jgi:Protein of unknown function (DUF3592)